MGKTIAFLAEHPGAPSAEEQLASFAADDLVVTAGRHTFNRLEALLAQSGIVLSAGDRIKVYNLSCVTLSTNTVIALLAQWLRAGIGFDIAAAGLAIEPSATDRVRVLLDILDAHYSFIHGIKTQRPAREPRGRKQSLNASDLLAIRTRLEAPGATAATVAKELGVARSTLFSFLERHDPSRAAGRKKKSS